jgi:hypothetical protein
MQMRIELQATRSTERFTPTEQHRDSSDSTRFATALTQSQVSEGARTVRAQCALGAAAFSCERVLEYCAAMASDLVAVPCHDASHLGRLGGLA